MKLIEILISSALGILLIAGSLSVYLSMTNNNRLQQGSEDLQAAARFSIELLNQRIRIAGYVGCNTPDQPINQDQAITGYDSAHIPSEFHETPIAGTDAIVINSCVSNTYIANNAALTTMMYYIDDTNRKNSLNKPILALFQKPLNGDRLELVAGVENMRIIYGVNLPDSTKLNYYQASQISDWQQVRSVEIDLLFNSIEPLLNKPQPYFFQEQQITPTDLLWRQSWNTYIALRERIHGY
jgi:hypothetical protein